MKIEMEIEETEAYELGFRHGLEEGVDMNPYNKEIERFCYRKGYDAGVSEYCRSDSLENLDDDLDIHPHEPLQY